MHIYTCIVIAGRRLNQPFNSSEGNSRIEDIGIAASFIHREHMRFCKWDAEKKKKKAEGSRFVRRSPLPSPGGWLAEGS
jgi:hypothetical protein